ncbi:MAG: MBL fold metallo-hydrolase [Myxococcales bacterium]|nr:MBL fold metallo-hydrolase [Myxococcales bacterium]
MWFRQLLDPGTSTLSYLVGDPATREALVIDPVLEETDALLAALREDGYRLVLSVETHVHADHVTGGARLRELTRASVAMPALASDCGCADRSLHDGDRLRVGAIELVALATPGHTPDSLSYLLDGRAVFTGDALLIGTCGRTDFQGGDAGALWDSLHQRLFTLADDIVVYPGHDYRGRTSSTIGVERRENARTTGRSRDEFIALMGALDLPPPRRIAEAVPANRRCGLPLEPHAA